ncbi:PREDICTED: transcription factor GTE12-like [Camelina sativa]|uniref:Transcription factor GTE12-like n=1 Tax=Camelina sativa TaxID=90675 RepID=A0ABM0WAB6_CAMSA|nr:PREDICTED: transcription factor GTE12-like [Camelina sativa]
MVTETKLIINLGSEANRSRKKRGGEEVEEELDQANTKKKQKMDCDRELLSLHDLCLELLKSMRDEWLGWRFEELVIENPDYFSVISKPMDFVTIKSKLAKNLYVDIAEEFPRDVQLVFENAIRYYPPESSLHKNAKKLKKFFELRWESVKKKIACGRVNLDQKVSRLINPVKEQSKEDKPESKFEFDQGLMPLSPTKALRAATIRIRFADTIVKAKYRKLIDESGGNKADVMMRIQKEKQLLEKREREVKARIEGEPRAARLKVLCKERLAIEELEEEAKFNIVDNSQTMKEMVKLCGRSYLARRARRIEEELGLFLRIEDYWPELEEIKEEGEI